MNQGIIGLSQSHVYESELVAMVAGRTTFELPLAIAPASLRGVVVCRTTEASYVPGDEVDVVSVGSIASAPVSLYWSSGKAYLTLPANPYISNALASGNSAMTLANWALKIYAVFPSPS